MKTLSENITSYLSFLKNDCGMEVSIHFSADNFYCLPDEIIEQLLPYNSHKNPYCTVVKKQMHNQCLATQRILHNTCIHNTGFCHTCHAGVRQYIYPLLHNGNTIGFAAICGYRETNNQSSVIDPDMWETFLDPRDIPTSLYETVMAPLSIMIERLFCEYAVRSSDEYNQILHYLNEYHTNASVSELCRNFGRSRSHISHLFKSRNGLSITEYCNQLKLEDAERLLRLSNRSVTEIALDTGFHDTSYFIRSFKSKYGTSPFKYRQNTKKKP